MAQYTKALAAGVGSMVVYTGANLDALVTLVGLSNVEVTLGGNLRVFDEEIFIGDGVCMDDTPVTPLPHVKIPAAVLKADSYLIDAVVYTSANLDAIRELVGPSSVSVRAGVLYVNGVLVAADDAVGMAYGSAVVVPAADLASTYTVVA